MARRRGARRGTARATRTIGHRQVNVRVEAAFHQALEAVARQDRRSIPQAARQLMEEALRRRTRESPIVDDTGADEVARLAARGGGFDWLAEEPDLYDVTSGEPA